MKALDDAIIAAVFSLDPAGLGEWSGHPAIFPTNLVPKDLGKRGDVTIYTVIGPIISDEDGPFKPGSHREVITQLRSYGRDQLPAAGIELLCEEYRTLFNRAPSALTVAGHEVVLTACSGYVWADTEKFYGRAQELRVLLEAA